MNIALWIVQGIAAAGFVYSGWLKAFRYGQAKKILGMGIGCSQGISGLYRGSRTIGRRRIDTSLCAEYCTCVNAGCCSSPCSDCPRRRPFPYQTQGIPGDQREHRLYRVGSNCRGWTVLNENIKIVLLSLQLARPDIPGQKKCIPPPLQKKQQKPGCLNGN
jgi:hypothetical protein